jgi:hypothetical protein
LHDFEKAVGFLHEARLEHHFAGDRSLDSGDDCAGCRDGTKGDHLDRRANGGDVCLDLGSKDLEIKAPKAQSAWTAHLDSWGTPPGSETPRIAFASLAPTGASSHFTGPESAGSPRLTVTRAKTSAAISGEAPTMNAAIPAKNENLEAVRALRWR